MAEFASGVLSFVDGGDSVGGAVELQLLLGHADRLRAAALVCTGARLGDEATWRERADLVTRCGTQVLVDASATR